MTTTEDRFWAKVQRSDACWEWQASKTHWGYGRIRNPKKDRNEHAHRFSWELHNGPIPEGMLVLHRCDNPPCVRPDHLFLGTSKDNTQDMVSKGRCRPGRFPGVKNPKAKLTPEQVVQIIKRRQAGEAAAAIARAFGVCADTVRRIVNGERWSRLGPCEAAREIALALDGPPALLTSWGSAERWRRGTR